MAPIISVCVPTYNGSAFFQECIDSILSQTFSDFELLIVDDKSSDRTVEIAKAYASKDSRITVIENPQNLGLVENWNRCIELSQCEWIKFVFQDDKIASNCLERMLEESTPDCDFVFCRRNFVFEASVSEAKRKEFNFFLDLDKVLPENTRISPYEYCQAVIDRPWLNIIGEPTSSMIRKRVFDKFGVFNPNLIQICDLEFWHRVATNRGITFIRENLATFRIHGRSTTAKNHDGHNYRMSLDFLILLHDFAFHPAYQNLRLFCTEQDNVDISELIIKETYSSWQRGEKIIKIQPQKKQDIEKVWDELIQKYPRFASIRNLSLLKRVRYRVAPRLEAIKHRLNSLLKSM